jgi:glycosyltransferase involved in cell wall biosynthesis
LTTIAPTVDTGRRAVELRSAVQNERGRCTSRWEVIIRREPVCVLIATLASSDRARHLMRALDSVRAQTNVDARPIVIVNGRMADRALVERIGLTPGVRILHRAEANLPLALAAGRALVDTPFFAQLDDDDELLPHALELRLARIGESDAPDAVVSNGVIRADSLHSQSIPDVSTVSRDPIRTLIDRNWMLPGAALFRTASMTGALFEATPRYLEWTYIGLLLASRYRIAFVGESTFVHYDDHAFSINRSREGALGRPHAFDAVLSLDLPANVKRLLRVKRGAAWHTAAQAARSARENASAWAAHLRSLAAPGGWRYLSYTRHLLGRQQPVRRAAASAMSSGESGPR